ncbi:MAG TPA: putative glycoside hydrolase [Gaiellaceae bacterium]|nr:putative glycoside hydrolase [Gaiellaceae bacterium]
MQIAEKVERAERRELRRRQVLRRRVTALAVLGVLTVAAVFGIVQLAIGSTGAVSLTPVPTAAPRSPFRAALPEEIRGIHLTMDLAGLPGRIATYLALKHDGLNTLEIDVKDETGAVAFVANAPAIAVRDGAARPFYDPRAVAREVHRAGMYLIGRVVTFEDPITSAAHPALAVHTSNGSLWHTSGGLGWLNPYSRAAWKYDVDVAVAAAKAGFDEIQFDYVRFPSDGDVSIIRYPGAHSQPQPETVAAFLRYAASRLHPLGVRVSADVFGLSATHNLGIGQNPAEIGKVVDTIYPMTYPSHYRSGEFNLPDPNAAPGQTVSDSLTDFRTKIAGTRALLVPWLQDFSLGRTYRPADVAAQVAAARSFHTGGFMLWNAGGIYTTRELRAGPPPPLPAVAAPTL